MTMNKKRQTYFPPPKQRLEISQNRRHVVDDEAVRKSIQILENGGAWYDDPADHLADLIRWAKASLDERRHRGISHD